MAYISDQPAAVSGQKNKRSTKRFLSAKSVRLGQINEYTAAERHLPAAIALFPILGRIFDSMKKYLILPISLGIAALLAATSLTWISQNAPLTHAAPLTTWHVNAATGNDLNDCLSPGTACETITEAADKAFDGDTVQIATGVYTEALELSKQLTLAGAGTSSTFLDGEDNHRVLQATSLNGLTLQNLTVQNGRVTGANGAGIFNFQTLTLANVQVINNTTDGGGAAIYNNGTLILQNTQVLSNTSEGVGAGIYNWYSGMVSITDSTFAHNAGHQGGGIYNLGDLDIIDSTIQGNSAVLFGAGLTIFGGTTQITGTTFLENQTVGYGGGIVNNLGVLTVTNSTVSANTAVDRSGIANISASAQTALINSTIAGNFATSPSSARVGGVSNDSTGVISLQNTLVADNEGRNCGASGSWTSLGNNLSSDTYCNFTAPGDLLNIPAQLAPLADYGGDTLTHALLPGSPAIDAGDNTICPGLDQRVVSRPIDGHNDGSATCDIGAYESQNSLTINNIQLAEGDASTTDAIFTVSLAPTSTQVVTVAYATADGTASAGTDYTPVSEILNFNPGISVQQVSVPVTGDTDDEPDQTFSVNLTNAVNADILVGSGLGTIIDDDGLSSLTLADTSVDEGNTGTSLAAFAVTLSPMSTQVVQVNFMTIDGTASEGADYLSTSGTLTFNPGETIQTIEVSVIGDLVDEGISEAFTVNLHTPSNANIADDSAVGTIQDDENARFSRRVPHRPGRQLWLGFCRVHGDPDDPHRIHRDRGLCLLQRGRRGLCHPGRGLCRSIGDADLYHGCDGTGLQRFSHRGYRIRVK